MIDDRAVLSLPISAIAIGERIGFYHADHAAALADAIAADGQTDPIHVQYNGDATPLKWTLLAGRHRLEAVRMLGKDDIDAIQIADGDADIATLRRLELSENLDHRNPRPLERAIFINARAEMEEAIDYPDNVGEARALRAARSRWDASAATAPASEKDATAIVADASNWRTRTAIAAGISERALRLYRSIYRAIAAPFPDLSEALNAHPLGESLSALTRIAQLETDQRRRVIETIIADRDGALATIDAAIVAAGLAKSRGNRTDDKLLGAITALSKADRLRYGKEIIAMATPGARRDLGFAAIAQCLEKRADFIAAAMDGLSMEERHALLRDASTRTVDLTEYRNSDQTEGGK